MTKNKPVITNFEHDKKQFLAKFNKDDRKDLEGLSRHHTEPVETIIAQILRKGIDRYTQQIFSGD